ncbi:hypothetical protein M9H77_26879 [Catharanthus roseus]|uniref:Uncharacterized protein n=1 Tax=Catharanthus roseus TaxID=4058 RepID=A0ACC0ABX2_CATRO|nr:hypothetical protein M9H77_26879 [Catharanthus roseus]
MFPSHVFSPKIKHHKFKPQNEAPHLSPKFKLQIEAPNLRPIPTIYQEKSTTEEISILEAKEDWIKPIQNFILEEKLPEDETKSRKIHTTSARYALIHSQLYRILRMRFVNKLANEMRITGNKWHGIIMSKSSLQQSTKKAILVHFMSYGDKNKSLFIPKS